MGLLFHDVFRRSVLSSDYGVPSQAGASTVTVERARVRRFPCHHGLYGIRTKIVAGDLAEVSRTIPSIDANTSGTRWVLRALVYINSWDLSGYPEPFTVRAAAGGGEYRYYFTDTTGVVQITGAAGTVASPGGYTPIIGQAHVIEMDMLHHASGRQILRIDGREVARLSANTLAAVTLDTLRIGEYNAGGTNDYDMTVAEIAMAVGDDAPRFLPPMCGDTSYSNGDRVYPNQVVAPVGAW